MLPVTLSGNYCHAGISSHYCIDCIAGRIRTCILFVPGEVSSQLECCYALRFVRESNPLQQIDNLLCYHYTNEPRKPPLHLTGKLILLSAPDIVTTKRYVQMGCSSLLRAGSNQLHSYPRFYRVKRTQTLWPARSVKISCQLFYSFFINQRQKSPVVF